MFNNDFERGIRLMLKAIAAAQERGQPPLAAVQAQAELESIARLRGRPPFFPYLGAGLGKGARMMSADGRWVLDLALGVGVHIFGHGNLDLIETAVRAACSDLVMQGNLIFNREYGALMRTLMAHAPATMDHCWLSLSGADANENALKLVRRRRDGRPGVIAFRGCFHGRTTAMAEITDRPDYRHGQPHTFPVAYVPFYDSNDKNSDARSLNVLRDIIRRDGEHMAAFLVELVQGEAGFAPAPREFFVPLFEECNRAKIPVWVDEVQTFGRVSELFATDMLGLADYVSVITVGKILQGSAVLFRNELAPDPNLISGTFSGATVAMAVGRRIIEKLVGEGFFGSQGREKQLERLCFERLEQLQRRYPDMLGGFQGIGAMVAFKLADGSYKRTRDFLHRCFEAGLALYHGGGGNQPSWVRMFLPAGVITDAELDEAFAIIERCLKD
jgi:4-aminobutyrate aminotransferase-like enzyme